jgi:hypothetical protein
MALGRCGKSGDTTHRQYRILAIDIAWKFSDGRMLEWASG